MRDTLERYQVWIYLSAIVLGLVAGWSAPLWTVNWDSALWFLIGVLLFATFTQIPLVNIRLAFVDARFIAALVVGNFIFMPAVVWLLLHITPDAPAIQLGVLLVLLVPCTDWFITFTSLGRGDTGHAVAATPILLLMQLILLPFYLWLLLGDTLVEIAYADRLLPAFFGLIILPLLLAWILQRVALKKLAVKPIFPFLAWFPIPLLAIVVLLIAASQVGIMTSEIVILWPVLLVFIVYLVAAAGVGLLLSRALNLPPRTGRTLVFSLATRNSFVMLPLALALPGGWSAAAVVIVMQSLVELFGMSVFLRWVPEHLIPDKLADRKV